MFAKFAIFTKFTISVKIATFKANPFAIVFEFLLRIFANVRYIRQDRHSQSATLPSHFNFFLDFGTFKGDPFCHLIRLVAKALMNSHHIRHFRESPHFQRAPLPSHLNFSENWRTFAIFAIFAKIATLKGEALLRHRKKLWRECAIFAIFAKFATFKLPLCHLI